MNQQTVETDENNSFNHELAGKYLTFHLAEETYGCPISPINDIIELKPITEVPQTSDYVQGVINLRGTVIPVIDLRLKFNMESTEYDRETVIIVVDLDGVETGLIVDEVIEVQDIPDGAIQPSPTMSHEIQAEFIAGLGQLDDQVIVLLDLDRILNPDELDELETAAEGAESSVE